MTAALRPRLATIAVAAGLLAGLTGCTDSQVGSIPESNGPDPRTAGNPRESGPAQRAPGRATGEAGIESR